MKRFIMTKTNNYPLSFSVKSHARSITCVTFFCLFLSIFNNCYAVEDYLKNNKRELAKIENYFNNIKNLKSDFIQRSQGGAAVGRFYLSRPGKMRVEYINQPNVLIVVNGAILTYKDLELNEVSRLRTNTTPASLLTRKNISFSAKDVKIVEFKKDPEHIIVAIIKKNKPEAGKFRLIFKREPFGFAKMEVEDDLGRKTSITLNNVSFPSYLDNDLFIIKSNNLPI